jgi:hypothetical protein
MDLDHLIGVLAEVDEATAEILMGHRMLRAKVEIVDRLVASRLSRDGLDDPKVLQAFRKIISNMHAHIDRRVLVVHGPWVTHTLDDGRPSPRAAKALSRRKHQKEISIEQTMELAQQIRESMDGLIDFVTVVRPEFAGWIGGSRSRRRARKRSAAARG